MIFKILFISTKETLQIAKNSSHKKSFSVALKNGFKTKLAAKRVLVQKTHEGLLKEFYAV